MALRPEPPMSMASVMGPAVDFAGRGLVLLAGAVLISDSGVIRRNCNA
jgi:hypothetical protein